MSTDKSSALCSSRAFSRLARVLLAKAVMCVQRHWQVFQGPPWLVHRKQSRQFYWQLDDSAQFQWFHGETDRLVRIRILSHFLSITKERKGLCPWAILSNSSTSSGKPSVVPVLLSAFWLSTKLGKIEYSVNFSMTENQADLYFSPQRIRSLYHMRNEIDELKERMVFPLTSFGICLGQGNWTSFQIKRYFK